VIPKSLARQRRKASEELQSVKIKVARRKRRYAGEAGRPKLGRSEDGGQAASFTNRASTAMHRAPVTAVHAKTARTPSP
jgi:hypothetical protein